MLFCLALCCNWINKLLFSSLLHTIDQSPSYSSPPSYLSPPSFNHRWIDYHVTNRFPLFPFLPQSAVVILVWHKTYIDCQNPSTYFNPFLCKCTSSKWIQPEFISNLISVITMHTLRTYCQLYTFLHLFFSHVDKQYYLCFNICLFQSTSVSTVQTVVYPGSDNSMCQLSLIDRGHLFCGFSPLCTHIWILRLAAWVVENLHWSHLLNFSPLFTLLCFFRFPVLDVEKLHWSHFLDFPPLCTFIWLFRFAVSDIEKLHWLRLLGFSPLCALMPTQLPNVTPSCTC